MCDAAEDPDEPAAAVDLISVAKDLCEDTEARPDLRGDGPVEEAAARPDLRGDGPVAGDELDADEDLLVDVSSEGTDADLCVDLVLSIYIAFNNHHT